MLLRASAGSRGATVKLSGGTVSDTLINALSYTAKSGVPLLSCNSTSFTGVGTTLVGLGTALTSGSGTTGFILDPAPSSTVPGDPVGVCLGITLLSGVANTLGGLSTSPVWQFNATSN